MVMDVKAWDGSKEWLEGLVERKRDKQRSFQSEHIVRDARNQGGNKESLSFKEQKKNIAKHENEHVG